jgi:hypothetical protein
MPHFGLTRPLGEFYFAHELRDKPCSCVLILHFLIERLLVGAQGLHRPIEGLQRRLVEAGADMPSTSSLCPGPQAPASQSTCATYVAQRNRRSPPPAHAPP